MSWLHLFGVGIMFLAFTLVIMDGPFEMGDSIPKRIYNLIGTTIVFVLGYFLYQIY